MDKGQNQLSKNAEVFVKKNWHIIKQRFANDEIYLPAEYPVSIFMAGSPGAGKTEVSKRLLQKFEAPVVRIDADEIRLLFDGYTGDNAFVFQSACTMAVNNIFGHCLKRKLNLILDATFAYKGALHNIEASLKKERKVEIYFIFQDPLKAWELTQARELVEHRRVTKKIFIESFFNAIENANKAKDMFGNRIDLNLIIKELNSESGYERSEFKIDRLDGHLPKMYTKEQIEKLIV